MENSNEQKQEMKKIAMKLYFIEKKKQTNKPNLISISKEYPDYYFVGLFSYDGEKLKYIDYYENIGKAKFYAANGNKWIYKNGEII